ncbi:MAG: GNAT family N-acetyltransferase [Caldilineaceae bacterium]|nr:GNAT family N-acetyltransferase [Caldilineaceae bacterium]
MNYWQGDKIRLRAFEPEDAETFQEWNLDSEAARVLDFVWPPSSLAGTKEWVSKIAKEEVKNDQYFFMIENLGGTAVGTINAHTTDRRVGTFHYGLFVAAEHRRQGYAVEAVRMLLRYFFEELRYQKCTVTVYSNNPVSQALHERLGFQLEGRLRRIIYTHGRFFDELYYGITDDEFAALAGGESGG